MLAMSIKNQIGRAPREHPRAADHASEAAESVTIVITTSTCRPDRGESLQSAPARELLGLWPRPVPDRKREARQHQPPPQLPSHQPQPDQPIRCILLPPTILKIRASRHDRKAKPPEAGQGAALSSLRGTPCR